MLRQVLSQPLRGHIRRSARCFSLRVERLYRLWAHLRCPTLSPRALLSPKPLLLLIQPLSIHCIMSIVAFRRCLRYLRAPTVAQPLPSCTKLGSLLRSVYSKAAFRPPRSLDEDVVVVLAQKVQSFVDFSHRAHTAHRQHSSDRLAPDESQLVAEGVVDGPLAHLRPPPAVRLGQHRLRHF